jgi:hypothetical protein
MICICGVRVTDRDATALITKPSHPVRRMVKAWHESKFCHDFTSLIRFDKAIRRNRRALESRDKVRALFRRDNYLFSTKTKDRPETLYFEDRAAKRTGRLRQQHSKGPLARIDKEAMIHLFLSPERYKQLKASHEKCQCRIPEFRPSELCPGDGRRHIEFACRGKRVSRWHRSEGTVKTSKKNLESRVCTALKGILGI